MCLPGKSHGQRSQAGYSPWSRKRINCHLVTKQETDTTCEATQHLRANLQTNTHQHRGLQGPEHPRAVKSPKAGRDSDSSWEPHARSRSKVLVLLSWCINSGLICHPSLLSGGLMAHTQLLTGWAALLRQPPAQRAGGFPACPASLPFGWSNFHLL